MKPIAVLRLVLCVLLLGGAARPLFAAGRQDLVAHGSGDRFWLARVSVAEEPSKSAAPVKTHVYVRSVGESNWLPVTQVEARVVAMAHRGPQLALLLSDGDWLLASEDALVTGRALPGNAAVLDIATSNNNTLLALGRVRTQPAGGQAAGPEQSAEVSERLALFALGPGGWADAGDVNLPAPAPTARADVSLAVVDSTVYIAARDADGGRIRVVRQTPEHGWADAGAVDVGGGGGGAAVTGFKLLGGGPVPVLWVLRADGGYALHWFGRPGVRPDDVPPPAGVKPAEVAAAVAIERIHVLYTANGTLLEDTHDLLGPPAPGGSGGPSTTTASQPAVRGTPIRLPVGPMSPWVTRWVQPLLTVALLFTVVASLRRRREMQEAMAGAHKLPLAPPGRRLLAGLIDAVPLLAAVAIVLVRKEQLDDPAGLWDDRLVQVGVIAGVVLYFAHTAVTEVLLGRTVGKMALGLRVVGLDGQRPGPGALLARNLLRVIDLLIAFFPLVLVLYSPLRQRAGDVAAGTLVVLNKQPAEPEKSEEAKEKAEEPVEMSR